MLRSYAQLFQTPGSLRFSLAGLLPRAAGAMYPLAIVMFVSLETGSYTIAGMVTTSFVVAQALASPQIAKLVDGRGQYKIMFPLMVLCSISALSLILVVLANLPSWLYLICSACTGGSIGSYNALVRSRWVYTLTSPQDVHTAFSWEASLEETNYVVAPVISTLLATTVASWAGVAAAAILLLSGALGFLSDTRTEPVPFTRNLGSYQRGVLHSRAMVVIVLLFIAVGSVYGGSEVSTVAFAKSISLETYTGLVLGIYALSSAIAGMIYGTLDHKGSITHRFVRGSVGIGLMSMTFVLAPSLAILALIMFISGVFSAPTHIDGTSLIREHVSPYKLTEGLAWMGTSINIGLAFSSTIAGLAIDQWGYQGGFGVVSLAAASIVVLSVVAIFVLKREVTVLDFNNSDTKNASDQ